MLTVKKNQVISRPSKSGDGMNLIVDGAFVYMDQKTYDRIMADETISGIEVGEPSEIMETVKDADGVVTKKGTGIFSRSIVQFVESDQVRLDNAIALQEKASQLKPETASILASLGITY